MKRILILGTGNAQVDAVNLCKQLGLKVYACSYNTYGSATTLADKFVLIDIADTDSVKIFAEDNHIDVVYSVGSDLAMPTACAVSEQLGLPHFVSYESADTCINKDQLRKVLGENGKENIRYQVVTSRKELLNIPYPFVLKPVDSQGQRGVRLINNCEEYATYFEITMQHSKAGKAIIEEYIEGLEVSVNAYLYEGRIIYLAVSDRITWDHYPGGLIKKHLYPSSKDTEETLGPLLNLVSDTTQKLRIENGPVYLQVKFKDNEPKIIEVTPRLDGCHLWRLLKYATSVDLLEMTYKHLLGEPPMIENCINPATSSNYCLEFYCEVPGGKVDYDKYNLSEALYLDWYYRPGEEVKPINDYFEKVGYVIKKHN